MSESFRIVNDKDTYDMIDPPTALQLYIRLDKRMVGCVLLGIATESCKNERFIAILEFTFPVDYLNPRRRSNTSYILLHVQSDAFGSWSL